MQRRGGPLEAVEQRGLWQWAVGLRHSRRVMTAVTVVLVTLAPVLVLLTLLALGPLSAATTPPLLRLILLVDLVYILIVATLVAARVARIITERRSQSAGSRLHLRLSGLFAAMALVPTVSVAVFASVTINVGLEGWFSDRVRQVVGNSMAAAEAYQAEQERDLIQDTEALARFIEETRRAFPMLDDGQLRQLLSQGQSQIQRGLRVAFVIDGAGEIRARGDRSYLFDFTPPSATDLERARDGVAVIRDWPMNEFRALVQLRPFVDRYLYVARAVDGEILSLLDETRETVLLYQQLERERGRLLFEFALLYLGFALILILAAVWLGLWFAERLARPVGRLAAAAEAVGRGNLDIQVFEQRGDDEIATMGRVFNQMTRQLKGQREALLENTRQIEARRRLFDSVLGSVTAGVMGLDADGRVEFINRAAERLLECDAGGVLAQPLEQVVPEFAPLFARLRDIPAPDARVQEELRLSRGGRLETLLVRLSVRAGADGRADGYVLAFDDVTDLVSAQRMAAWGDVARRIAHEIKNPLTPIQLSAERIKRKFRRQVPEEEAETLDQLTGVIVRQTGDLRRIVDEFSRFARMPEPDRRSHDLVEILRDAVLLQENARPDIRFAADIPDMPLPLEVDATMLSQAFTNILKNGSEAIDTFMERGAPEGYAPELRVAMEVQDERVRITVAENGIGLPEDRARLFEPYVTTRDTGTGLGLPIVKKIIEEHGGSFTLQDAPHFEGCAHRGALAEILLPRLTAAARSERDPKPGNAASGQENSRGGSDE
ncbi:MAG: PAS domain-containing sensor histidine kinase [Rhodobacteraceae bacterium]|nr:PAS domain-containing sensor histidine kinase [Paracoccaceae bacterium]